MTGTGRVRGHTRRTSTGGTTRVRAHQRRRGIVSPGHSWKLARRAWRVRKRRKVTAVVLGTAAVVELGSWLTLSGIALVLATFAVLAGSTAYLAASSAGMRPLSSSGGKQSPRRGKAGPS